MTRINLLAVSVAEQVNLEEKVNSAKPKRKNHRIACIMRTVVFSFKCAQDPVRGLAFGRKAVAFATA